MAGDYSILSAPRIGLPQFTSILAAANSPALGEAAGIYNAAVARGVDPAFLLAVFQHESNFGKAGVATRTRSIGNLVYTAGSAPYGSKDPSSRFTSYATYTQAAADAARLLAGGLYGSSDSYNTAQSFARRYAPAGDGGNNPSAYGAAVVRSINTWTGAPQAPTPAGKPAVKPAAKPAASTPVSASPVASQAATGAQAGTGALGNGVQVAFTYGLALAAALLLVLALFL